LGNREFMASQVQSTLSNQLQTLNEAQASALVDTVISMLSAYSTNSSEEYGQFRFPVRDKEIFGWDPSYLSWKQDRLINNGISPRKSGDPVADCIEISKQFFDLAQVLTNGSGKKMFSAGNWTDVSFKSMKVTLIKSDTDRFSAQSLVLEDGNINLVHPTFSAYYSPKAVLKKDRRINYALVKFVVRMPGKHDVYPVYTTFFWDTQHSAWLAHEVILPTSPDTSESLLF